MADLPISLLYAGNKQLYTIYPRRDLYKWITSFVAYFFGTFELLILDGEEFRAVETYGSK